MNVVGPARLCRMDEALVSRIARGQDLGGVALGGLLTILLGAGAYGFAFGVWRAPEQALYSSLKLPLMVVALVLATTSINAMLALLLRAPLGLRQSAVVILVGLAVTAAILGALSPVSTYVALSVAGPDPTVFGLPLEHPAAAAANRSAQSLLLYHVAVIAIAGVLGNLRLFALLRRLAGRGDIAIRVLVAWLAVELLAGSQLSWIFRPFLGRPHRVPELVSSEMFHGSFFEEVYDACSHALGLGGMISAALVGLASALTAWALFRRDGLLVTVEPGPNGLDVRADEARFFVRWEQVSELRARQVTVLFEDEEGGDKEELAIAVSGAPARRLLVRCASAEERDALAARIERLRSRLVGDGPFRQRAVPVQDRAGPVG